MRSFAMDRRGHNLEEVFLFVLISRVILEIQGSKVTKTGPKFQKTDFSFFSPERFNLAGQA